MAKVLAGDSGGPDGLRFAARKATVSPADISIKVQMDQQGSFVELRDKQNELLFRLDGRQLDELYAKNQLDVTRPDKLKESVLRVWESSRPEPPEPNEFVLDLKNIDPEQLKGRLKLLIDWLDERVKSDVYVDPHKKPEPEPAPEEPTPEESAPEESAQPAEESAPPEESSPEESAPPEGSEPEEPAPEEPASNPLK